MTKQLNNNNKLVRWESEFLSMEPKNGIHEYANTQSSKQIGSIKEEESTKLSTQTQRGVKSPLKVGLSAVFISFLKPHYF